MRWQGVVSKGTAHALGEAFPGTPMAGKTGTTNDYKNSWFVSIDGRYVVTAWLGTDDNKTTWLSAVRAPYQWCHAFISKLSQSRYRSFLSKD